MIQPTRRVTPDSSGQPGYALLSPFMPSPSPSPSSCDNFLYGFQGHALRARQAVRPRPGSCRRPGGQSGECVNGRGAASLVAGVGGGVSLLGGRQLGPLPLARQCTGAGRCRRAVTPSQQPGGPRRYAPWVIETCKNSQAVLPAPGIMSPRKIAVKVVRPRCAAGTPP